jgi:hypothetical protein
MKSSRQLGILAVLLLQSLPTFADDVITNVMSPVVSYQYQDDFSSAGVLSPIVSYQYFDTPGESGTAIISPIVSYQYFDWPGYDVLNLQSSPKVSYLWQVGSGSAVLHGWVRDANGNPLSGVTVSALNFLIPAAQATTDANGYYQMPSLGAGLYDLWALKAEYQLSVRIFTLGSSTSEQDFQLKPIPPTPATLPVNRSATVNYSVDAKGSRLLLFNGTVFAAIDANNFPRSDKMTIVLTHGWVVGTPNPSIMSNSFDRWPTNMATKLWTAGITTAIANITAWDWRYAASDSFPPSQAVDLTPDQGVALGEALTNYLGTGYSKPLHFIGHSLGTIVNAAAANFLHGDSNGNARRPASSVPWTSPMHMTLFDEAQIAEQIGNELTREEIAGFAIDAFNYANGSGANSQSPLPNNYVWADNYISLVGAKLKGAVNINLQKSPYSLSDFADTHSYPIEWYSNSIVNPTDPNNPLGFQRSYEYTAWAGTPTAFPPSVHDTFLLESDFEFWQDESYSDQLALTTSPSGSVPHASLTVFGLQNTTGSIQIEGNVSATMQPNASTLDQLLMQNFASATESDAYLQGAQIMRNVNSPAVLQLNLSTSPSLSPNLQAHGLAHPLGLNDASSNAPPMAWLPIQFPSDAVAMAFDFTVSGDPVDDALVCGVVTNYLFTLQAKYISTNQFSISRLIDVSAWAGTTNELFFGFMGGTSTNATLTIENIRFYSLAQPSLQISTSGNITLLSWPSTAGGYVVESTPTLAAPIWEAVTNAPAIFGDSYILTNAWSDQTRFFRLHSQ